ncbi:MAG: RICIN domain-containing protein [Bryobacteraceae bacterium]|nr:RICIN domain-containing protein [Bryobacteraceae bacterium]
MKKRAPESATVSSVETVGIQESAEGFVAVKDFLKRFGYLQTNGAQPAQGPQAAATNVLDDATSVALVKYQARHRIPVTGVFDAPTREMMSRSRCAIPDIGPGAAAGVAPAFSIAGAWNRDTLTYAFGSGTNDVTGGEEFQAVRRAFATWSAAVQIAFREVSRADSPDILIEWTVADCPDTDMTGNVIAHADYPPGFGFYGNALPRPVHFDNQEHTWCIGAVAGQFDVETVALHELGHILGLQHSDFTDAVMFDTVDANATRRFLTPDDIEGIRRLYPYRGPVFAKHSGRCLDIEGIATGNGAHAHQWDYWGGQNQIFRVEWVEASHYRLIAQHSNRVIDVEAISTANGAQIHQWQWWGGDNQKFRLDPLGGGYYRLSARHSNKCIDVEAISTANGARIHQWDWWGGNNQQWRLGPAPIVSRHSGKALDVYAISFDNGAPVIQWDYWGGGNQRFRLDPVDSGFYRIMAESSGKCLDVEGISTANGARIIQWEYWGGANQQFRPEATGDGFYRLVARHSGKVLDVSGISADNGAQIIQWDWWGGNNQQWRL